MYGFHPGKMLLDYRLDIHSYSNGVAVPFFRSPSQHLISLRTHDRYNYVAPHRLLLFPMNSITSHIGSAAAGGVPTRVIPWNDWGAPRFRWVADEHFPFSRKFISNSRFMPHPPTRTAVVTWDFSRVGVTRLEPQRCNYENFPYVETQVALPIQITQRDGIPGAITEDALICWARSINIAYI